MTQGLLNRPSLRERALAAGGWMLAAHGFDVAVGLISNLIMTRLLFPEAFGLIAAASAPIAGLTLVSDFGVHAVIIQSPRGEEEEFLRSAWVFQLWRGFVIWIILAIFCGLISIPEIHRLFPIDGAFADRSFPLITAAAGIGLVLSGAESTAISLNSRRLNLKPLVLVGWLGRILSLPIMIIWAWIFPSVWAVIGGGLAGGVVRLILSHTMVPGPRMALKWNTDHIQEIVHFGKWIVISSVATFVSQQSDIFLFGFLLPSSVLGIYSISKMLVSAAEGLLERFNAAMTLPVLGEVLRDNRGNFRNRYYRFRLPIDVVAALISGILLVTGSLIVSILYDTRYSQAGPMLQILAIGTVLYPFHLIRSGFTATGHTRLVATVTVIQAASMILCITIGYATFGAFGAIVGISIHRLVPTAVIMLLAHERRWISVWHELRIIPIFVFGIIIGEGVLYAARIVGFTEISRYWH